MNHIEALKRIALLVKEGHVGKALSAIDEAVASAAKQDPFGYVFESFCLPECATEPEWVEGFQRYAPDSGAKIRNVTSLYTAPPASKAEQGQSCYCPNCEELGKRVQQLEKGTPKYDVIAGLDNYLDGDPYPDQKEIQRKQLLVLQQPSSAPHYGIIDPDYARVFTVARCLAWAEGYALAMHGSFTRDLDLIAVPWADTVCAPDHLIARIADAADLKVNGAAGTKPHGRRAYTLLFKGFADPRWIDISVLPRSQSEPDHA